MDPENKEVVEEQQNDPPKDDPKEVVQDPPEQEEQEEADQEEPESWGSLGSEEADAMLTVLQESGIKKDRAKELLWDAVVKQDINLIDFDALKQEMKSEAQAKLVLTGVKSYIGEIKSKVAETQKLVVSEVGSEETWNSIKEWVKDNLGEEELQDYVELLSQGGRKAKLAVRDMKERYEEAGNTIKGETVVPKTSKNNKAAAEEGISRRDYYRRLEQLHAKGRPSEAEKQKLFALRQKGIKEGK